jgi:catechol 2,3-dioxygenase-like lactoylglutathione lyase family enzyme
MMTDDAQALQPTSPVTGISHVQLIVSDLARSERWYTVVLGLERLASADGQYVALKHRTSRTVVVLSTGPEDTPAGAPAGTASDRLDHLAFAVADGTTLREWGIQLSALGIVHGGVVDEDGRPSLMLTDPDGIRIELVAPS